MGATKIIQANGATLKKDCISFCPKIILSYKWIFEKKIANCYNKCIWFFK